MDDSLSSEFFERVMIEESPQAYRLSKILIDTYHPESVSDCGCANGLYIAPFIAKGIKAYGYDNGINAMQHSLVKEGSIIWGDVTVNDFKPVERTDFCLCLEVLEHCPPNKSEAFVEALTKISDRIIFSVAVPGQGGDGHINCMTKDAAKQLFAKHNYFERSEETSHILNYMKRNYHLGWLVQNLLVMVKLGNK